MKDIADRAGVSPTTVSFVLNERPEALRIREETRLKVLKAAEELGYRSNQWARAMRTGNTQMLGFLGGNTEEEHVGRMLRGALQAADAQGYTIKLMRLDHYGDSAKQVIRRSSEMRLMGIIALHLMDSLFEELHHEAHEFGTPFVLLDARHSSPDIIQVVSDDENGVNAAIAHLVGLGHKRIAFIGELLGELNHLSVTRRDAFLTAITRHSLEIPAHYLQNGYYHQREPSVQAAKTLLSLPPAQRPTAIFCAGDLMALATLQVAMEMGIRVPQDVSLVGFANMTATEFLQLTTVEQPFLDMGRVAVDTLLTIVGERGQDESIVPSTEFQAGNVKILPTRLIERASTAPPHH